MIEKIIEIILKQDFTTTILIIPASLLLVLTVLAFLIAFLQGREISFWPPKIGALNRSREDVKKGENRNIQDYSRKDYFPYRMVVNCAYCGHEIKVTNPRLKDEPKRLYTSRSSASRGGTSDYIEIGCPDCKGSQFVQFEY